MLVAGMVDTACDMLGADARPIIRPFRALVLVRFSRTQSVAPLGWEMDGTSRFFWTLLSIGGLVADNERDVWRANIIGDNALLDAK
jgi:hypothetical protein